MARKTGSDSPFFVGYAPPPRKIAAAMLVTVAALFGATAAIGVIVAGAQRDAGTGVWLADETRTYEGVLRSVPYPTLFFTDQGEEKAASLISTGKLGVVDRVQGMDGQRVRIKGFHVERQGRVAIEFIDGTEAVEGLGASGVRPLAVEPLGTRTVQGEIVDSKCFLGVMKPGDGKAHKACATLCIIGGVPGHFVVRHEDGFSNAIVTGPDGGPMPESLLRYVADPVEVTGALERIGPLLRFRIDPASVRRL